MGAESVPRLRKHKISGVSVGFGAENPPSILKSALNKGGFSTCLEDNDDDLR